MVNFIISDVSINPELKRKLLGPICAGRLNVIEYHHCAGMFCFLSLSLSSLWLAIHRSHFSKCLHSLTNKKRRFCSENGPFHLVSRGESCLGLRSFPSWRRWKHELFPLGPYKVSYTVYRCFYFFSATHTDKWFSVVEKWVCEQDGQGHRTMWAPRRKIVERKMQIARKSLGSSARCLPSHVIKNANSLFWKELFGTRTCFKDCIWNLERYKAHGNC